MLNFKMVLKTFPLSIWQVRRLYCTTHPWKVTLLIIWKMTLMHPQQHLAISHQQTVCDESFSSVAPSHTGSGGAPARSSASALKYSYSFICYEQAGVLPQSIDRLKALISKENRTQTGIKVGTEEAPAHFNVHVKTRQAMMVTSETKEWRVTGAAGYCQNTPPSSLKYVTCNYFTHHIFLASKNLISQQHFVNMLRKMNLLLYYVISFTKIKKFLSTWEK